MPLLRAVLVLLQFLYGGGLQANLAHLDFRTMNRVTQNLPCSLQGISTESECNLISKIHLEQYSFLLDCVNDSASDLLESAHTLEESTCVTRCVQNFFRLRKARLLPLRGGDGGSDGESGGPPPERRHPPRISRDS